MFTRVALAAVATACLASSASAQSEHEVQSLTKKFETQLKEFGTAKEKANKVVLDKFDALVRAVDRSSGLSADTKVTRKKQLEQAKELFKTKGTWAEDGLPLDAQYEYARAINKAYLGPAKTVDDLIRVHDKAKNDKGVTEWQEAKAKLDGQIPGRADMTEHTRWNGTLTSAGGHNEPVRLEVGKITGNLFTGKLEQNVGVAGHPVFVIGGRVDGNGVGLAVTKVEQGRAQLREFGGFLIGEGKMVVRYVGIHADRKPFEGYIVLHRPAQKKKADAAG